MSGDALGMSLKENKVSMHRDLKCKCFGKCSAQVLRGVHILSACDFQICNIPPPAYETIRNKIMNFITHCLDIYRSLIQTPCLNQAIGEAQIAQIFDFSFKE